MSNPAFTESLVLQRIRALGVDDSSHKGQCQEQEDFQDNVVQQSFEAKKSVFMKPNNAKTDEPDCTTHNNSDTLTIERVRSQQPSSGDGKSSKDIASSIRVFESKGQVDSVLDKSIIVNDIRKTFEQKSLEPAKDSKVSKRIQELSGDRQVDRSQVQQLASRLETKQKSETEKPVHSTLTKLKEKFEASSSGSSSGPNIAGSQLSKALAQKGYVMETSKLFGGAAVFTFSGVPKSSSNESYKNADSSDSKSGSNVQSKVLFYIKFQEQRKDETFSPRSGSEKAEADSQRFSSVAELRALFGTAGKPNLQKLSKKNRQADISTRNNNAEETQINQSDEKEEEGDVMLEQALCRRILGKEVRRALKDLLSQQRLDALKCQATEKDIEGREVKPLIDEFQQRKMDDSEQVGVFTNRMRKGRLSMSPEVDKLKKNESNYAEQAMHEMEDDSTKEPQPDVLESDNAEQEESRKECDENYEKNNVGDDEYNEEGSGYGSYEIVIDPDFVRRRIEELQAGDDDESDSEEDEDDDEPVLIKTKSGRIVVDTSQYQKMSVRMAMRIAF
ncbi:uncharacterized protein Gasu_30710 [Galdieria sulphuraria]|uniref:Uncharacterized protein n=1 Tax=Galdieria sulphuraria TaxID=130081 RepID=M2WZX4_GALSU|nr:uncharacterized protein Gasu_30710 [Galdieria sulphuraria]EME29635.1 hypothetical protein Gasu_30710 [Galdieria sulphuraria]|eukprot:XP_005706155.1 hypothetical protein Gasu_30710 [Galdieria sulphuraria]